MSSGIIRGDTCNVRISQQNKKPRIEETEDKKDTNTSLLNLLNKGKAEQDKYRATQTNNKTKTDKNTYKVTPPRVTIISVFANRQDDARAGARALARGEQTDERGPSSARPFYSEHPT
eukprot:14344398-Heterocapsa_arctica.AAC.1